jgi:long-chain fatty acid transport protein
MKDINVGFVTDSGQTLGIQLPQNYKDQTILALGAAYQTGNWTLRGGVRLATQALRSETLFAVIPATPRKHVSAGFSYAFSKENRIDFAYSHALEESMDNASLPNTANPIQTTHSQNNLTLGYTHRF